MRRYLLAILLLGVVGLPIAWSQASSPADNFANDSSSPGTKAAEAAKVEPSPDQRSTTDGPKQIIKNKEMMKLLFDPYYVELRKAIREQPQGRAGWRRAYIAIFRICEVTNLLYSRKDKDYMLTDAWRQMATQSRDAAESVGQAVLKLDYPLVRRRYEGLVATCNACHQKFEPTEATEVQVW
jgi:hypothetical protein